MPLQDDALKMLTDSVEELLAEGERLEEEEAEKAAQGARGLLEQASGAVCTGVRGPGLVP